MLLDLQNVKAGHRQLHVKIMEEAQTCQFVFEL